MHYHISALDLLLCILGSSEITNILEPQLFKVQQIDHLPTTYNGNTIFELPPIIGIPLKGLWLQDLNKDKDCYTWARLVKMSVKAIPKNCYKFGKLLCIGHLTCHFNGCNNFLWPQQMNQIAWFGRFCIDSLLVANKIIPNCGLFYAHFSS